MSKRRYTEEFKKNVLDEFKAGEGGYKILAKKHSIPAATVKSWIKNLSKEPKEPMEKKNEAENTEKTMTFIYLYDEQFEKLKQGEKITINLPLKSYWTRRLLKWGINAEKNNSNTMQVRLIHTKVKFLVKVVEIKLTLESDLKTLAISLVIF